MEDWNNLNVVVRRLIHKALVLVAEINQALATDLNLLEMITHEIILGCLIFVHQTLIEIHFFSALSIRTMALL